MEINRLAFSRHNRDLLIILITIYVFSCALFQGAVKVFDVDIVNLEQDNQKILLSVLSGIVGVNVYVTAWAYRTATSRLTAVDVLVSDMYSICRGFISGGSIHGVIDRLRGLEGTALSQVPEAGRFVPSISDLGFLETASIHRIIGFYESLQVINAKIATLGPDENVCSNTGMARSVPTGEKKKLANLMYCYFLACENARIAIHRLLRSSPTDAFYVNCLVVCFSIEFQCIGFLLSDTGDGALVSKQAEVRLRDRLSAHQTPLRDPEESYRFPAYSTALAVYFEEHARFVEAESAENLDWIYRDIQGRQAHG